MGLVRVGTRRGPTGRCSRRADTRRRRHTGKRLRYYARQFGLVEVDASCYALPAEQTAMVRAARTPAGFTFNVKGADLAGVHFDDIFPHGPEQAQELVLFGFPTLKSSSTATRSSMKALNSPFVTRNVGMRLFMLWPV
jgi:hypothetical protein